MTRQLHFARDNQVKHHWRGMVPDLDKREDELGGKTLLIVGLGRIGSHLARLAKAFGMRVIGTKRDPGSGGGNADDVFSQGRLGEILPLADFVALTCPLTPQTEGLINAQALARMKPSAFLINVARGKVVDEAALIAALGEGRIAGAGLDCTVEEPLPAAFRAVGYSERADHAAHRRRDAPVRGQRDRSSVGESRSPLARRDRAEERDCRSESVAK